jgi:hypothetical protein
MHKIALLISTISLSTLLTGCVGTGPSTERGAVTGGVLGALAGAVIGHNTHGGDALGGAILGATAGALAGGAMGNSVDHERGTIYGAERTVYDRHAYVQPPAPPAPPAETITASPAPNALWIPGYWTFDGARYTWTAGHWEIPPPNARTYVASHWENQNGVPVFVQGSWR